MDATEQITAVVVAIVVIAYLLYQLGLFNRSKSESGGSKKSATKKSAQDNKKYPAGKLHIYYGSQTGTAMGFAATLRKEGKAKGFDAKDVDLEDFDPAELADCRVAIFVMATYGEGESTDNAKKFYEWMQNENASVSSDSLNGVGFTVFGLGSKEYPDTYNKMGKFTNDAIAKLGGKRVFDYGEGDAAANIDDDFENWKEQLWPALLTQFGPAGGVTGSGTDSGLQLQFKVVELAANEDVPVVDASSSEINTATKHFFTAPQAIVAVNRELRNTSASKETETGSTRHIEIELVGTGISYETADNLAILPENDPAVVNAVASALGFNLDTRFAVEPVGDARYSFPSPCTVREALTEYFDLQGHIRPAMLKDLLPYITNAAQKDWLSKLLSKESRSLFKSAIVDEQKSLVDLLQKELSSCKIPLEDFLNILPFMQPRYYTISSSSSCLPDTVHITVSITQNRLPSGKVFKGVSSGFIQTRRPGQSTCRIFVRPSTFRLPKKISTPIVLIGPGTGIAPMRALLQERKYQGRVQKIAGAGRNTLYFGCKYSKVDYIYRDELEQYLQDHTITKLHLAFSRDQKEKVYVQTLLKQPDNAAALIADIDAGAYIFVCGATAMGNDVHETIVNVIAESKKLSHAAALEVLKDLQAKGRYVQELWSE